MSDPYDVVDPVLIPWAEAHGLVVRKVEAGHRVRLMWLEPLVPESTAQLDVCRANDVGYTQVHDGHFKVVARARDWTHATDATLETLASKLDEQLARLLSHCL
jgi:hypothetical protein